MRRKVIQIAESTQLISLPRKWALSHNIKKGDEIEIVEDGKYLTISAAGSREELKTTEINLTGIENILNRILGILYKIGYDQISIKYSSPEFVSLIQKSLQEDMIGYEIVEQHPNRCVIKTVAASSEAEFDSMLRRTYLLLKSMLEGLLVVMESGDKKSLPSLRFLEKTNNKYTAFCRRVINKNGLQGVPNSVFYCLVEEIEKIADQAKYLCDDLLEQKTSKVEKDVLDLFKQVVELYNKTYDLHYSFDVKKLSELFEKRKLLNKEARKIMSGTKTPLVVHHALSMIQSMANVWSFEVPLNWK